MTSRKAKYLLNRPETAVDDFIQGLLIQYPNRLVKLQNHNVLLLSKQRAALSSTPNKVELLSGGGCGHEPAMAGFIGNGMLSGAICGGMFASPSVKSVSAAIRSAAYGGRFEKGKKPKRVLLIVMNYTGDRMNFGIACEKANSEGIPCQMIVVADDCAIDRKKGITGARGIAGTILIHKIAGAAAEVGKGVPEIVDLVDDILNYRIRTMGLSLNSVTIPGSETVNDRLMLTNIEVGLGIHGEAGLRQMPLLSSRALAKDIIARIHIYGKIDMIPNSTKQQIVPLFRKGDELCIMVNNLGGTSNFELSIFVQDCVKVLEEEYGCDVTRVLVGAYMTSFNMHGASLTILNLTGADPQVAEFIDYPTDAPAWLAYDVMKPGKGRPSAKELEEIVVPVNHATDLNEPPLNVAKFWDLSYTMLKRTLEMLISKENLLTEYDVICGDGDFGITMKRGATAALTKLKKGTVPVLHPVAMFAALADIVSDSMGGTSGILLELMFRNMSTFLASKKYNKKGIGIKDLCRAVHSGTMAICLYGGAGIGSRTLLDALIPAADVLNSEDTLGDLKKAAEAAKIGASKTAGFKSALAGRSNYLGSNQLYGTPDPGAVAVWIVFDAISDLSTKKNDDYYSVRKLEQG